MITLEQLKEAVSEWREAVSWIADGWDCIEEYWNDLAYRESLQKLLDRFVSESAIPQELTDEIARIDAAFMSVTEASDLCVWDSSPAYQFLDNEHVKLLPIDEYDKSRYWYYYRWQPDCPYAWRGINAQEYQKLVYGLDFAAMSHRELVEAVKNRVARLYEQFKQTKGS